MAGQIDGFNGGRPGGPHSFLPTSHSHVQPTQLATSESTSTDSSRFSIPYNLAFDNYKVLIFYIIYSLYSFKPNYTVNPYTHIFFGIRLV